jgi:hypothetical protein
MPPRRCGGETAARTALGEHYGLESWSNSASRGRLKPSTTSSPTTITGTAIWPVRLISSSRPSTSVVTSTSVNATPLDERNSFAALQGRQVGEL